MKIRWAGILWIGVLILLFTTASKSYQYWCTPTPGTPRPTYAGTKTITPTWDKTITFTPGCNVCTETPTPTLTMTFTPTTTSTSTATLTQTSTVTVTPTGTIKPSDTPTVTVTPSVTSTGTQLPSYTPKSPPKDKELPKTGFFEDAIVMGGLALLCIFAVVGIRMLRGRLE